MANDTQDLVTAMHLLVQRCATVTKDNKDSISGLELTLTQAIAELARATDNWTKIASWAAQQGFDPSDYETSNEN
ncbi:MAG: hypothetical protein IJU79_02350 [Desulfovibrionaceae bacterium]|nr:hypothetical protein [Desulfovibrionaceae bacterium]